MVRVSSLVRSFQTRSGKVRGVAGLSFEAEGGRIFTLLGPSGCGKTTTMRLVAGLDKPDEGSIWIGGETVADAARGRFLPPAARGVGMVFQSYALWPHMDVFENVAFPLRVKRVAAAEIRSRVAWALELVGLAGAERRAVSQLSGGEQQRVAVARAIAPETRLLLLDEPLSNLDAKVRGRVRGELRELQRRIGVTTLYVTHDQEEAMAISDTIAVFNQGRIVEQGPPAELYERPRHLFTATFLGSANLFAGRVTRRATASEPGLAETEVGRLAFCAPHHPVAEGAAVTVAARPEHLILRGDGPNRLEGRVVGRSLLGPFIEWTVSVGERQLLVRSQPEQGLAEGDVVAVALPPERCIAVEASEAAG